MYKYSYPKRALNSDIVVTRLGHVPHPGNGIVATGIGNLQVPHIDSAHSEVGNLERQLQRLVLVVLPLRTLHGRQRHSRLHPHLLLTHKSWDLPNNAVLIRVVAHNPTLTIEIWIECITRNWNMKFHIIRGSLTPEQCSHLRSKLLQKLKGHKTKKSYSNIHL